MTNQEIANTLVDLFNKGEFETIYANLYSPEIESIEADGPDPVSKGMDAINAKNEWWMSTFEVHSMAATGPFPNGEEFAVIYDMDITEKASGHRIAIREVGVYTTTAGKIVREKFYYPSHS